MEQGKRPLERGAQQEAKKQRTVNRLMFGEISLPEGPAVDFKERLAKPLGKAMIIVGGGASSQQHRLTVKKVVASRIKPHVVKYLSKMPSCEMLLPPFVPRATPIQSEAIANADMQTSLFDLVNFVFRQLPDDSGFYKQYAILMNPLKRDTKALTDALKAIWHHSGASGAKGNRPDNLLLRTWNAEGFYEAQPDSLYNFEGKQLDVFSQYFNDEEVESGNLELADNWDELGVDAKHAVGQLAQYLIDDGLERGILYTRHVLWEVRVTNPDEKNLGVSISEPVTATDTNPSMAEVVFACVHEQMDSVRTDWLEGTGASAAKASSANKEPQSGGFGDESDASGPEKTTEGPMSSDVEIVQPCRGATKGDKLLCDLDDSEPALHGNSVVRIGRVNGVKVAAKMVPADEDAWVRDEIENESRCLEALRSLQGSAIVEKLFASTTNQGRDRLLVTKFVEGTRLDKAEITEEVAASARSALRDIHKKGYIHGDVTSRNIIVQPSGKCVFVDLGRARLVKAESEKRTEMLELEADIKSCFRRAKRTGCV